MGWGSDTDAQINGGASPQNVVGTELHSDDLSLNAGESMHVQVKTNSGGTTDSLYIAVYGTLDDTSEVWDTVAVTKILLDATDGNDNTISFIVTGLYRFRIGFVRDGSTDTLATSIFYRKDGISV